MDSCYFKLFFICLFIFLLIQYFINHLIRFFLHFIHFILLSLMLMLINEYLCNQQRLLRCRFLLLINNLIMEEMLFLHKNNLHKNGIFLQMQLLIYHLFNHNIIFLYDQKHQHVEILEHHCSLFLFLFLLKMLYQQIQINHFLK